VNHRVTFHVAHQKRDPLAGARYRQDIPPAKQAATAELAGLKVGWLETTAPLTFFDRVYRAAVCAWNPPEWLARQLARELLHELIVHETSRKLHDDDVPPDLERMKQYVMVRPRPETLAARPGGILRLEPFHGGADVSRASPHDAGGVDPADETGAGENAAAHATIERGRSCGAGGHS